MTNMSAGILHKETQQRAGGGGEQMVSKSCSAFSAWIQKKSGCDDEPGRLASILNLSLPNGTHHLISPLRHFFIYKRKRRRRWYTKVRGRQLLPVWLSYGSSYCVLLGSIISQSEEKCFLLQVRVVYFHVYRSNIQTYWVCSTSWLSPRCPLAAVLSQEADLK